MKLNSLHVLVTASLVAGSLSAQGATYRPIPGAWNGADITPDGKVVVGDGPGGAFYWRWQEDPVPTLIGNASAAAVSDDGSVIAGSMTDPGSGAQVAALWTEATGWQPLGGLPSGACGSLSTGYDITADGSAVVGLGWNGCSGQGFYWTEAGGMQGLEHLANGNNRGSVIAANGSIIGGFAQGSFNRTPATWLPDLGGQTYDVDAVGEIHGVNADGSVLFGEWNGAAFYSQGGVVTPLGSLDNDFTGIATSASESLSRIVGFDILGLSRTAWIWTPAGGMESLHSVLTDLGTPNLPPFLEVCRRSSADGTVIVGNNGFSAWLVTLPPIAGWNQYGTGAADANNLDLDGAGDFTVGGTFFATTSNVVGTATATLIALDSGNVPFLGGRLLLDPLKLINPILIETAVGGSSTNTIPIPNDAALAGVSVFFQSLAEDGGQAFGFGFSNGLELHIGL